MIKVLIFDLDDTLYYEKEYVLGAFKNVCIYLGKKYNKDIHSLYNRTVEILEEQGRGKIFNSLCEENKFEEDISKLVEIYRNSKPKLALYEDSNFIFKYAKNNKLKLGIITDGCSKVQWSKIEALNLKHIIDKIIVTDDYGQGFSKPNKKAYIDIIECLNVKAEECIYVGDNPNKDFIGAKELGIVTMRIVRGQGDHIEDKVDEGFEADFVIKDLKEIINVLE